MFKMDIRTLVRIIEFFSMLYLTVSEVVLRSLKLKGQYKHNKINESKNQKLNGHTDFGMVYK